MLPSKVSLPRVESVPEAMSLVATPPGPTKVTLAELLMVGEKPALQLPVPPV